MEIREVNDANTHSVEDDFARAFLIAKEALSFVGKFRTPPTPSVYEVWYRYAEGVDPNLRAKLDRAVDGKKSISVFDIESLYQALRTEESSDLSQANLQASETLNLQLSSLQLAIGSQLNASSEFQNELVSASSDLKTKDATAETVQRCIATVLANNEKMNSQLNAMKMQLSASENQVAHLRDQLLDSQRALITDPLTGVGNRRFFDSTMAKAFRNHPNPDAKLALLLVDLDDLKHINDTFGHAAGDEVLTFIASELVGLCGDAAIARFGGDEFAIVVNGRADDEVHELAQEISDFFGQNTFSLSSTSDELGQLTVSIGMSLLRPDDTPDSWFDRADALLYSAKESGRNCVRVERRLHSEAR